MNKRAIGLKELIILIVSLAFLVLLLIFARKLFITGF